jgi:hypothetical protein
VHLKLNNFNALEALKPREFVPTDHRKGIQALAISKDYYITGGSNNDVKIWSNSEMTELVKHIQMSVQ